MISFTSCDMCKHTKKRKKDGWIVCCDAFIDGISSDYINEDNSQKRMQQWHKIRKKP